MRKRTMIRLGLLVTSVCLSLWQAPRIIEMLDSLSRQKSSLPGMPGVSIPLPDSARAALEKAGLAVPKEKPKAELVVFSPDGKRLNPDEQKRLLDQAERMRPKPPSPPAQRK